MIATDADLTVRLANPKAVDLFGLGGAKLVGLPLLRAVNNEALEGLARRCLEENGPAHADVTLYGESTRNLSAYAAPVDLDEGRIGVVLVLNDMTEVHRLERVRKDFVANVSHELKTPITLIKGFADTLLDGSPHGDEETARFLAIIQRHANRMTLIVDDLLTLARLEGPGHGGLDAHPVDARFVVERAIDSLGDQPAKKAVSIAHNAVEGLEIMANEGLLEHALVNLLDNAVKYGPEGGTVTVAAMADGAFARFTVTDCGPGIPERDVPRLFERFYRVDKARSRDIGGTGLGLAIVRHIALAHGGDVSVSSREGYGSTFILRVPLATGLGTEG